MDRGRAHVCSTLGSGSAVPSRLRAFSATTLPPLWSDRCVGPTPDSCESVLRRERSKSLNYYLHIARRAASGLGVQRESALQYILTPLLDEVRGGIEPHRLRAVADQFGAYPP